MRLGFAFLASLLLHALLLYWLIPTVSQQGGEAVVSVTPSEPSPNLIMPIAPASLPGEHATEQCITNLQSWLLANANQPDQMPPDSVMNNIHCVITFQRPSRQSRTHSVAAAATPTLPVPPPISQQTDELSLAMPQLVNSRRDTQKARFLAAINTTKANICQDIYDAWVGDNQTPTLHPLDIPERLAELDCESLIDLAQSHNDQLIKAQEAILAEAARQEAIKKAEEATRAQLLAWEEERRQLQKEAHAAQQARALEFLATQRNQKLEALNADITNRTNGVDNNQNLNTEKSDQQLIEEALARRAERQNMNNTAAQSNGRGLASGSTGNAGNGLSDLSTNNAARLLADSPVRVLQSVQTRYPTEDKLSGHEGIVTVRAQVSATGKISNITVVQSSGFPGLDQAAQATLQRYRFAPAIVNGQPAASAIQKTIIFQLK